MLTGTYDRDYGRGVDKPKPSFDRLSVSIPEAAERFGIPETTLRKWIREAGFPIVQPFGPGTRAVVPIAEAERWMKKHTRSNLDDPSNDQLAS